MCSQDQFPDYPEALKMSISLGRRMQEPLQEFGSLAASTENEFLALRMHPLQGEVEQDRPVVGEGGGRGF